MLPKLRAPKQRRAMKIYMRIDIIGIGVKQISECTGYRDSGKLPHNRTTIRKRVKYYDRIEARGPIIAIKGRDVYTTVAGAAAAGSTASPSGSPSASMSTSWSAVKDKGMSLQIVVSGKTIFTWCVAECVVRVIFYKHRMCISPMDMI